MDDCRVASRADSLRRRTGAAVECAAGLHAGQAGAGVSILPTRGQAAAQRPGQWLAQHAEGAVAEERPGQRATQRGLPKPLLLIH